MDVTVYGTSVRQSKERLLYAGYLRLPARVLAL
jgi:hypothetical protein